MSGGDLSGEWHGIFNYPDHVPATAFTATLGDAGGALSGTITEPHHTGSATMSAMIHGRREESRVTFVKLYDALDGDYDEVAYQGDVDDAGQEIAGRWHIAGAWSGSFIMVRARSGEEAVVDSAEIADDAVVESR